MGGPKNEISIIWTPHFPCYLFVLNLQNTLLICTDFGKLKSFVAIRSSVANFLDHHAIKGRYLFVLILENWANRGPGSKNVGAQLGGPFFMLLICTDFAKHATYLY